ncbi:hypothetical protein C8R43DRAFT_946423 [Mycena crocata]|nr:hypothetical protein C8R43DRAFT_946423 [Mycena crocata]
MTCSWPQRCSGWCFLQCCALDTYIFPSFANATLRYDPEAVWNGFIKTQYSFRIAARAIGTNVLRWALLNITLFLFPYVAGILAFLSIHPDVRASILQDWQYVYAYAYFSSWMASTLVLIGLSQSLPVFVTAGTMIGDIYRHLMSLVCVPTGGTGLVHSPISICGQEHWVVQQETLNLGHLIGVKILLAWTRS